ncbi:MAG TPA: hypothetical protein DCP31_07995 [Cyanobacteria bacterium UBA8543]|nr:hypothetical protein [Cyanobacteria bacterium UBA8543]
MSKISRKPGLSIRRLARSRSIVSTVSFATAAFLVVVAPVIFVALGQSYDLGRDSYGKPKDLLKCVKGQALELARNNRLRWVTPIICFTGDIELDATIPFLQPLQGVYVSRLGGILDLLNRLENG